MGDYYRAKEDRAISDALRVGYNKMAAALIKAQRERDAMPHLYPVGVDFYRQVACDRGVSRDEAKRQVLAESYSGGRKGMLPKLDPKRTVIERWDGGVRIKYYQPDGWSFHGMTDYGSDKLSGSNALVVEDAMRYRMMLWLEAQGLT